MDKWFKNHKAFLAERLVMACEQTFYLGEGFLFLRRKAEKGDLWIKYVSSEK